MHRFELPLGGMPFSRHSPVRAGGRLSRATGDRPVAPTALASRRLTTYSGPLVRPRVHYVRIRHDETSSSVLSLCRIGAVVCPRAERVSDGAAPRRFHRGEARPPIGRDVRCPACAGRTVSTVPPRSRSGSCRGVCRVERRPGRAAFVIRRLAEGPPPELAGQTKVSARWVTRRSALRSTVSSARPSPGSNASGVYIACPADVQACLGESVAVVVRVAQVDSFDAHGWPDAPATPRLGAGRNAC